VQYAIDKRTGKLIDAEGAGVPAYARYVCPCCSAEVHLRRGSIRVHYFAHNSGKASPDCENYHLGFGTSGFAISPRSGPAARRASLSLYLQVPDWTSRVPSWHLQLQIPQTNDGSGFIVVEDGLWGQVSIPAMKLLNQSMRVSIRPTTQPVRLRAEGLADTGYFRQLEERVPQLHDRCPNIFRYSERGGRCISAPSQPLFWGRGYFVVHHQSLALNIPSLLRPHALLDQGDWKAHVIEFPDDEDDHLRSWADRNLTREVEVPPVRLELIEPSIFEIQDDDALVVLTGHEVIVGVIGEPGSHTPSKLCLTHGIGGQIHELPLPSSLPTLISLGQLPEGLTEVYLPDQWDAELTFHATKHIRVVEPPAAELVIESMGRENSVPFHSQMASKALQDVKESRLTLKRIKLPKRLGVTVLLDQSDLTSSPGQRMALGPNIPADDHEGTNWHTAFEEKIANLLRQMLAVERIDLQIDFGNFGLAETVDARSNVSKQAAIFLPESARRTAKWLLATAFANAGGELEEPATEGLRAIDRYRRVATGRSLATQDEELLSQLVALGRVPVELEPHVRALAHMVLGLKGKAP